jgi:acyl-[acyl-carrier-protein] desaturase
MDMRANFIPTFSEIPPPPPVLIKLKHSPEMYSPDYRKRLLNQYTEAQYKWYTAVSQPSRQWKVVGKEDTNHAGEHRNIDKETAYKNGPNFDNIQQLKSKGGVLSDDIGVILKGFFSVELFAPKYVEAILEMLNNHGGQGIHSGRSAFTMKWGSEEQTHSDAWEEACIATGVFTRDEARQYKEKLHEEPWKVPPQNLFQLIAYVVVQEEATKASYLNFKKLVAPQILNPNYNLEDPESKEWLDNPNYDPELYKLADLIARDETAHHQFFKSVLNAAAQLFPSEVIEAILHVTDPENFVMPAGKSIPSSFYRRFQLVAYKQDILSPQILADQVFGMILKDMDLTERNAWIEKLSQAREIVTPDGYTLPTALFGGELVTDWLKTRTDAVNIEIGKYNRFADKSTASKTLDRLVMINDGVEGLDLTIENTFTPSITVPKQAYLDSLPKY